MSVDCLDRRKMKIHLDSSGQPASAVSITAKWGRAPDQQRRSMNESELYRGRVTVTGLCNLDCAASATALALLYISSCAIMDFLEFPVHDWKYWTVFTNPVNSIWYYLLMIWAFYCLWLIMHTMYLSGENHFKAIKMDISNMPASKYLILHFNCQAPGRS